MIALFMKVSSKHLPFWLITLSMFVAVILPTLLQDGMFMDGLLYASISKNLADGIGTFWFPHFSQTLSPVFHEHPPLVFGIQSLFFKILGDSIYVERFYSFLTACITGWLIILVWKQIFRNEQELKKLAWLPFFCWIIMPLTFWSFAHNMQENTMGIFTILSVYMIIKWFDTNRKNILFLILSGVFIFLASFSKGFPGLFPLVVIGIYWIVYKDFSFLKMLMYSIILILVPVIIYFVLMLDDEIFRSLSSYLHNRAFYRIEHNPTVDTRFWIAGRLFMELLPVLILNMILLGVFKLKSIDMNKIRKHRKPILMFLLIGAAGSLPLMATTVQKGFYMVHSFPFYAIGLAIIVAPGIAELLIQINTKRKSFKIFQIISIILIIATITFSFLQIGKTKRNKDIIHDVHLIGVVIPSGSIIGVDHSLWQNWSLHCYFVRHYYISLGQTDQPYDYLLRKKMLQIPVSEKYQKTYLATKKYDLYQLK